MISIYAILLSNDVQNQLAVFVLRYFGDVEEPKRRPILDARENSNNSKKNTVFVETSALQTIPLLLGRQSGFHHREESLLDVS